MIASSSNQRSTQVPTTVVNGFLGSGKTTIINGLIEYILSQGQKPVYIKNEIGDTDLDTKIIQGQNIQTKELLNGCICCTLVGPFINAIDELIDTIHPDRIIIESAGTADPASIALMVENHPRISLDGTLVIIDVVNFQGFARIDQITRRQAEQTDLIVFNKVELADNTRKRQVVGYVRELNEQAPIVEAPHGKLNPLLAFGISDHDLDQQQTQAEHTHQHHPEEDHITAFTYHQDKVFDLTQLEPQLQQLPKNIFRVKGLVQTQNGTQILNGVFNRFQFSPAAPKYQQAQTELIFIGYEAEKSESEITNLLNKL